MIGNWELEERARMSEASQTTNDPKSAVVMEYSTVQKIVQILDNDADLIATKMAMKDLNAKQNIEEKKVPISNLMESQFDHQSISEYTPQEQYNWILWNKSSRFIIYYYQFTFCYNHKHMDGIYKLFETFPINYLIYLEYIFDLNEIFIFTLS